MKQIGKETHLAGLLLWLIMAAALWIATPGQAQAMAQIDPSEKPLTCTTTGNRQAAPGSCTIFTVSKGNTVFFGNTEDWINPNTYIWSIPARGDEYGGVFFGFDNLYPQGGVNEMGLAFDWNALPEMKLNPHPELAPAPDKIGHHLLASSATVEEAITYLRGFSWGPSIAAQMHLADAGGDAAVMSAGTDGELTFTRKEPGDGYLVSTNFNLAAPQAGGFPCNRYERSTAMLEQVMLSDGLAVEQMADIMAAVHQEGATVNTVYANAIELSRGVIYLYHWYQFDETVTLEVSNAIGRFTEPTPISELFSRETVDEADRAYQRHLSGTAVLMDVADVWIWLLGISLVIQVPLLARKAGESWNERLGWIAGAASLGPISLVVRFFTRRSTAATVVERDDSVKWIPLLRASMVRAAVYSFILLLSIPYFVFVKPSPGPVDILGATYVLPLLLGLLLFRGLPYAARMGGNYRLGLRRLTVSELIAHNLLFGALISTLFFLSEKWFSHGIEGDNPLVWLAFGISTLAGAVAVLPFKAWLTTKGVGLWPWKTSAGRDASLPRYLNLRAGWPGLTFSFAFAISLLILAVSQTS